MSKKRGADRDVPVDEDLKRVAIKHAGLKMEYNDLQRETRALKKRLQRAKQKKSNLLAEVRFMRRRHKFLTKNSSLEAQFNEPRLQKPPLATLQDMRGEYGYELSMKKPQPATTMAEYGHVKAGTSYDENSFRASLKNELFSSVDLTHSPEKNPPAAREFQVFWEPLRTTGREDVPSYVESFKRNPLLENGGLASDLNLSIFKDIANGFALSNRTGKRKISWQDQMALRV